MKQFSFVILLHNEEEFINRCLESIKDYAFEIVVGDNECTDQTIPIVKDFCKENNISLQIKNITLKELYDNGYSWARNQLFEMCEGNLIHIIDGDERLGSIENVINFKEDCYSATIKTFINNGDDRIHSENYFKEVHNVIFKKDSGIRHFGIVHETLGINNIPVKSFDSGILHLHYSLFKKKNKQRVSNLSYALLYKAYLNKELKFLITYDCKI